MTRLTTTVLAILASAAVSAACSLPTDPEGRPPEGAEICALDVAFFAYARERMYRLNEECAEAYLAMGIFRPHRIADKCSSGAIACHLDGDPGNHAIVVRADLDPDTFALDFSHEILHTLGECHLKDSDSDHNLYGFWGREGLEYRYAEMIRSECLEVGNDAVY